MHPHRANVQFRLASVGEPTSVLSNLDQINRRGHSNATTKAYAKPRDCSVQMGDDEVYHINQTPPQAGTRRGVAFEPLCVPSEKGAPREVE